MWKVKKLIFGELQVRQAISPTLYEVGTSGLAYSNRYDLYLMILHYPWLGMKVNFPVEWKMWKK